MSSLGSFSDSLEKLGSGRSLARRKRTWVHQILFVPIAIGLGLFRIFAKAIQILVQIVIGIAKARTSDIALCVPFLLMTIVISFVFFQVWIRSDTIKNRYRIGARDAMAASDFQLAKTFYGRILNWSESPSVHERFEWARVLELCGEHEAASAAMAQLAPGPGGEKNYAPAHRFMALSLVQNLLNQKDEATLNQLKWHLDCSDAESQDVQVNRAFGIYYLSIGEKRRALEKLELVTQTYPKLWLSINGIYGDLKDEVGRKRAMDKAISEVKRMLEGSTLNHEIRILLATLYTFRGSIDDSERVLVTGLNLKSDRVIRRALSDFYVLRHDLIVNQDQENFDQQFEYLKRAIQLDVHYPLVYQRLISQFSNRKNADELNQIKGLLETMIAEGHSTALGHFALSNLLWVEDDKESSQWHMEQAYRMDENLFVVANNLAWLLAHSESPDLDRARDLAGQLVANRPDEPRFHDTLGTIIMKQGEYEDAIVEFEKALEKIEDKKPVHKKLSAIYEKLGMSRLAQLHAQKAGTLEKTAE